MLGLARDEPKRRSREIGSVMLCADPERLRQPSRPSCEQVLVVHAAPCPHTVEASTRLQRAQEHRRAHSVARADDIRAPVDAVGAVHVEAPRRPEHARIPRSATSERVARRIVGRVGLGLHDDAADAVQEE